MTNILVYVSKAKAQQGEFFRKGFHPYIISGLETSSDGLDVYISAGKVMLNGEVFVTKDVTIAVSPDKTTDIAITKEGNFVTYADEFTSKVKRNKDALRLCRVISNSTAVYYLKDVGNKEQRLKHPLSTYYNKEDFENHLYITSGIYQSCYRYRKDNGIIWYFSSNGLWLTVKHHPERVKDYILKAIEKLILNHATARVYEEGMFCISNGFVWQAIAVTGSKLSASSSPFSGTYSIDSEVTDGEITWKAVYLHFGTTQYFWLDVLSDLITVRYADSHDSYAASLIALINEYIKHTGDTSFLNQQSKHGSLSNLQVLVNMVTKNMITTIDPVSNLTKVFQEDIHAHLGTPYPIRYCMDNFEVAYGFLSFAEIFETLEDSTNQSIMTGHANTIISGINNLYATYYDPENPEIELASFYRYEVGVTASGVYNDDTEYQTTHWLLQFFADYLLFDYVDKDKRDKARKFAYSLFPNSEDDSSVADLPMLVPAYTLLLRYNDKANALRAVNYIEKYVAIEDLTIQQLGLYLAMKDLL